MRRKTILLHPKDNVATALVDLAVGELIVPLGQEQDKEVTLLQDIHLGHKFALEDIAEGEDVFKYGMPIGRATQVIRVGEHVHTHNLASNK